MIYRFTLGEYTCDYMYMCVRSDIRTYIYVHENLAEKKISDYIVDYLVKCTTSKQECARSHNKDGACSIFIRRKKVMNYIV